MAKVKKNLFQRFQKKEQVFGRSAGDERPEPTQEEIAKLAYEFHIERGGAHGNDWEDWFRAEDKLKVGCSKNN